MDGILYCGTRVYCEQYIHCVNGKVFVFRFFSSSFFLNDVEEKYVQVGLQHKTNKLVEFIEYNLQNE